ncbi:hypothetical protein CIB84_004510 [Bambusicola thoracicus]|uniref:Calpain catalytic domain-containing protein n=1 Tax=Bambusicola thoracicus TaxID=9083 RepID=A0A2P4T5U6_BAMTH|nr:hypothetical protein CIB84_004510 [Bambusicola thoracicus]
MPLLPCLKKKKSPGSLGKNIFQKHSPPVQQNYQALLEMCLKNKQLFTDESFPADISSIGTGAILKKLPRNVHWKRPHALHRTPVFYAANRKQLDLCQGLVGNCWFLAALQALTFHQDILAAVVPQNQSFERKYAGIFHFRFWHFGEWVDVVVDDRLPVNEAGELVFVSSVYKNVFWGALLEKAYAKLRNLQGVSVWESVHEFYFGLDKDSWSEILQSLQLVKAFDRLYGSYEDLQIGQVSEALVDFTGGVNIRIKLPAAPPDLWDILTRATYSRSLMCCQTQLGTTKVLKNGLVAGHAYTVTGIRKVTCQYGPENLVRLRNPWGKIEWNGDWSDRMSLQDFKIHFVDFVICKLTPDLVSQEDGKKWMYSLKNGRWVKGSTAGGSLGLSKGMFWMNPQYWLNILASEDNKRNLGSCSVVISLMQKHSSKHRNRAPHLFIGFSLYKVARQQEEINQKLPPAFFTRHQPVNKRQVFLDEREVTCDFHLEPGVYVIVPSTLEPHQESEFILRVFSRKHILREMGGNASFILSKEIVDRYEGKIWEDFFTKHFEQRKSSAPIPENEDIVSKSDLQTQHDLSIDSETVSQFILCYCHSIRNATARK